jgi:hypothetical protein
MEIVIVDVLDGRGKIPVAVATSDEMYRLMAYFKNPKMARTALSEASRQLKGES